MWEMITIGLVAGYAGWNWGTNPNVMYGLAGLFLYLISWGVDNSLTWFILWVLGTILVGMMFCHKETKSDV